MGQKRPRTANRIRQAVELFAEGHPPHVVAERLGISRRTVQRYLTDPEARGWLDRLRDERLAQIAGRALTKAMGAPDVLWTIAESLEAPPAARVQAAGKLLDLAVRLYETANLAERVAELERRLQSDLEGGPQGEEQWGWELVLPGHSGDRAHEPTPLPEHDA